VKALLSACSFLQLASTAEPVPLGTDKNQSAEVW
jgi:hypothetical protein